jgi:hypothetical protein
MTFQLRESCSESELPDNLERYIHLDQCRRLLASHNLCSALYLMDVDARLNLNSTKPINTVKIPIEEFLAISIDCS